MFADPETVTVTAQGRCWNWSKAAQRTGQTAARRREKSTAAAADGAAGAAAGERTAAECLALVGSTGTGATLEPSATADAADRGDGDVGDGSAASAEPCALAAIAFSREYCWQLPWRRTRRRRTTAGDRRASS